MSTAPLLDPQQHPPPLAVEHEAYNAHSAHASVGPVIAVLAVIAILGVVAGMIGRLCTGRKVMGHYQYDIEGWVETKCASCIDGTLSPRGRPPLHRPPQSNAMGGNVDRSPEVPPVPVATTTPIDAPDGESKRTAEHTVN